MDAAIDATFDQETASFLKRGIAEQRKSLKTFVKVPAQFPGSQLPNWYTMTSYLNLIRRVSNSPPGSPALDVQGPPAPPAPPAPPVPPAPLRINRRSRLLPRRRQQVRDSIKLPRT